RRNSGQWHSPTYPAFQTSRFNELKARTTEKQWTVALSDIADYENRPLMSLDYVPNTIAYKHLHRLGVYTQLTCTPSQIGSIHSTHMDLHRLGVYTQPTCPFHRLGVYTQPTCPLDWEYTLNPHAPYVAWEYTLNPHALYTTYWTTVDEFRLRTEHDCLSKHLHRLGVYTQLTCTPSQIGSIHSTHMDLHRLGVYTQPTCPLHRLGVYTQPICPFTDWEYTLNPHALCTDSYRTRLLDKTPSQIAVDEFRLRTEHDCLSKHLHRLGVYTQLTCTPSQIGSIHSTHMDLHRLGTGSIHSTHMPSGLGVYTQPTCPLCSLGVYTQPTCPLCNLRVYTQPTSPLCNLQEEMVYTQPTYPLCNLQEPLTLYVTYMRKWRRPT
ncbi:unnamed protein product, partial [Rodentolepis nana]|uniref:Envelope glycoprotein n=1 Tax=Rodentolepis nana TaxID=102285 RepID=A0A0R3TBV1_RODNA